MAKNQYRKEPLKDNVEEMFIGPFGSSLKNECFVDERNAYCMVYEQKHAIQKTLTGKNRFVDRNKYQELKRFTVKPGDIIVSCRGTIGETFIVPENAPLGIMHPSIMKIRLKPNVYNIEYFNLLLKSRLEAYNKSANGSGVKMAISATELGKDLFPIPPMDEQQKISRIFFMVEHLILLRKQQLAKMDALVKARFVEMFGDPMGNPMKWNVSKIEDIAEQEKNALKAGPFGSALKKEFYVKSGYKIYGQEQVICGDASVGDYYIDEEKYKELKNCAVQAGDILISLVGTYGKALIMPDNYEAGIINPRLMKITLNKNKVKPIYFKYYFESDALKASMDANTHGGTMGILNLGIIRQMKIQVPPLSIQNQFAAFVERVDQQKQTVQQSLEKLELMKKVLMQEYFG